MAHRLSELSVADLQKALALRKQIDDLSQTLDAVTGELDALLGPGGSTPVAPTTPAPASSPRPAATPTPAAAPAAAPRKRRGKASTLRDAMVRSMRRAGKPLNLQEIHDCMLADGYEANSKDFKRLLSVKLYTDDAFLKVRRGYFTVRDPA